MGADGLKTGHTNDSGYGLTGTVKRGDRRLILVVNGLPTKKSRSREPKRLFEWGFREFQNHTLFKAGDVVADADIWLGKEATVPLVIDKDLMITLARKGRPKMKVKAVFEGPIPAPVAMGTEIARLIITVPGEKTVQVPLVAGAEAERLGLLGRLGPALKYILWGGAVAGQAAARWLWHGGNSPRSKAARAPASRPRRRCLPRACAAPGSMSSSPASPGGRRAPRKSELYW